MNKETEAKIRESIKPWRDTYPELREGEKVSLQIDWKFNIILSISNGEACIVFDSPISFDEQR